MLIASRNNLEHISHIEQVLKRLKHRGLKINIAKCEFAVLKLEFLGHVIDDSGITPISDKAQAIK